MKYFIGIVPPLITKERIIDFQKSFRTNQVPFIYEPHITLKSPHGLSGDRAWLAKILTFVGSYPRFQIKFDKVGGFNKQILFLNLKYSEELMNLHKSLLELLNIDKEDMEKCFEGPLYHPYLTLGETTWGKMDVDELEEMKKRAEFELSDLPAFQVDCLRVYEKEKSGDLYQKLIDIPLKI